MVSSCVLTNIDVIHGCEYYEIMNENDVRCPGRNSQNNSSLEQACMFDVYTYIYHQWHTFTASSMFHICSFILSVFCTILYSLCVSFTHNHPLTGLRWQLFLRVTWPLTQHCNNGLLTLWAAISYSPNPPLQPRQKHTHTNAKISTGDLTKYWNSTEILH